MPLAISTAWNAATSVGSRELLFEIAALGFKQIELSFNLTSSAVKEIAALAKGMGIEIVSLHNFCPIPDGLHRSIALPDYYSLASLDEAERLKAIKYAKISIDTASLLEAKAVVLHCGRVEINDRTRQLINLYNKGLKGSEEFNSLKDDIISQRSSIYACFLDNTLRSLDELNKYASKKDVLLGIENRFYYREIPGFEEIGFILKKFRGSQIGYWHDTGHAQVMEMLGLAKHKDFLDCYGKRLIGAHIHDTSSSCQDHLAPFQGSFDFQILKPFLSKKTINVVEAHSQATSTELIKSRQLLEKILLCG